MTKVFISYSHDSPAHKGRVLALANKLNGDGLECIIDQYVTAPPMGWPRWMMQQVEDADKILVIITQTYAERVCGRAPKGTGLGATFEGLLAIQQLYESGSVNEKLVPVLMRKEDSKHIPLFLKPFSYFRMVEPEDYNKLYRYLTGQPEVVVPETGKIRKMDPKPAPSLFPDAPDTPSSAAKQAPPSPSAAPGVFVYFDEEDKKIEKRLQLHLKPLAKRDHITMVEQDLMGDHETNFENAINQAEITVLLISISLLADDFFTDVAVPKLLDFRKRGKRLFPIIVNACNWEDIDWLSAMRVFPDNKQPLSDYSPPEVERLLTDVSRRIGTVVKGS